MNSVISPTTIAKEVEDIGAADVYNNWMDSVKSGALKSEKDNSVTKLGTLDLAIKISKVSDAKDPYHLGTIIGLLLLIILQVTQNLVDRTRLMIKVLNHLIQPELAFSRRLKTIFLLILVSIMIVVAIMIVRAFCFIVWISPSTIDLLKNGLNAMLLD